MGRFIIITALSAYALLAHHVIWAEHNPERELTTPVPIVEVAEQQVVEEVVEEVVERVEVADNSYVIELDDYAGENDTVIVLQRVSFYNLVPEQTSPDPSTSSCAKTVERQIAVSQDLFFDDNRRKHLCGARVTVITDNGHVFENYVLNDTTHSRYRLTADVVYPGTSPEDIQAALAMGISTGTLIIHAD